jgi:hypothetical protein
MALSALPAADPNPAEKAAALVKQLGSPRFAEREAAVKAPVKLGPAALPAVRAGLRSGEPEVKARCGQLLPQLEQADWALKSDAHLADHDGKGRHDLPLRETYEKLAGTDPAARKLYAEMLRTSGPLLRRMADA